MQMQPRDSLNDGSEDLVDAMYGERHHTAATALVGAKKRKALRVIKHQQVHFHRHSNWIIQLIFVVIIQ